MAQSLVLSVGQTVELNDGRQGIVLFQGTTTFAPVGTWIGIELPEATGKNDGSVQGARYFTCQLGHGMFVRATGIKRVIEQPQATESNVKSSTHQSHTSSRSGPMSQPSRSKTLSTSPTKRHSASNSISSIMSDTSTTASSRLSEARARLTSHAQGGPHDRPTSATSRASRSSLASSLMSRPRLQPMTSAAGIASGKAESPATAVLADVEQPLTKAETDVNSDHESDISPDLEKTPKAKLNLASNAPSETALPSQAATKSAPTHLASGTASLANKRLLEEMQTKLRLLERKRIEDRDKLKALDVIKHERDKFETIINRLQQKYQPQQKELADLRQQLAQLQLEKSSTDQAEHDAELENATLDREMAEEQYEVARGELTAIKEKLADMTLENEVLRAENEELGREMSPEDKTSQGWLQLERSNERLREALVRLRDVTQDTEAELRDKLKTCEVDVERLPAVQQEVADLKEKEHDQDRLITDLKQQLDISLQSEEMIEDLSGRNTSLQEQIATLKDFNDDLHGLNKLNDELISNYVETENQIQSEIDYRDSVISNLEQRVKAQQIANDESEMTIAKFRQAVGVLQGDVDQLRASRDISEAQAEDLDKRSRALLDKNMQLNNSTIKLRAETIRDDQKTLEANEAARKLDIVQHFLPSTYKVHEESIQSYLTFERIAAKAELVRTQLQTGLDIADSAATQEDDVMVLAAMNKLCWLTAMCQRFSRHITSCSPEEFDQYRGAVHEIAPIEKATQAIIEGMTHDTSFVKTICDRFAGPTAILTHLATVHIPSTPRTLADEVVMQASIINGHLQTSMSGMTALRRTVKRDSLMDPRQGDQNASVDGERHESLLKNFDDTISRIRDAKTTAERCQREILDLHTRSFGMQDNTLQSLARVSSASEKLTACIGSICEQANQSVADKIPMTTAETLLGPIQAFASDSSTQQEVIDDTCVDWLCERVKSLTTALTQTITACNNLDDTVEMAPTELPWVVRSRETTQANSIDSEARVELSKIQHILEQRTLLLRQSEHDMKEQNIMLEVVQSKLADTSTKLNAAELTAETLRERESVSKRELDKSAAVLQRLRLERDALRASSDAASTHGGGKGGALALTVNQFELQRERQRVNTLQSTIRYMTHDAKLSHTTSEVISGSNTAWLSLSLSDKPRSSQRQAIRKVMGEEKAMLRSLLQLDVETPRELEHIKGRDKLAWQPLRTSCAWNANLRREKFESWRQWQLDLTNEARTCLRMTHKSHSKDMAASRYMLPVTAAAPATKQMPTAEVEIKNV